MATQRGVRDVGEDSKNVVRFKDGKETSFAGIVALNQMVQIVKE